ncbi:MAG: metallophosphoesterase family protein [Bacteroidales bacterium]|nr:metallophosphoesterase family protein [Bacteroidales bacterium]
MKKIFTVLAFAAACLCASAQKPELKFNEDGTFKVLQFTDLHMVAGMEDQQAKTFARIRYAINEEKPDVIAVTGDVITGGRPCRPLLQNILDTLDSYGIPFFIVFGNHDREQDLSMVEMSTMIASGKHSINLLKGDGLLRDMRVPVACHDSEAPGLEIYAMDSHTSIQPKSPYDGKPIRYEWFTFDQVKWIRSEFEKSAKENGSVIPSVAFFHIPLPEFLEAWQNTTESYYTHNNVKGVRGEYGGHSRINSGMFAAMLESGSTMGVFCGHDHDSDFIVNHMGIALAYGRFSGDDTTYHHLLHGTRVIVFKEGQRAFKTWIREDNGMISYSAEYADGELR